MALINCPECKSDVSDSAFKCPSCGHQVKKPKRTLFGKIVKIVFILFNLLMIYSIFAGMGASGDVINNAASDAERAGAALGAGMGAMMLGILWVVGDIIIGTLVFLTRPKA
ncbi:MAG: hypothetical protein E6Z83_01385 [Pantoea sp.]|uniref:Zinc ribbon domain-containing protein n=1 Tax=Pantoea septica TaxID=472695 RepID=A0ABX3UW63_9GAMM|nr:MULTISPECIES: seryl-tRNA synthetase class IIa [Pantoea]MDU5779439.1 hypothetical protein [Pantoea sp.]ORN02966.1 hypothetical protein HA46_02145 [Pantoea septica]